MLLPLALLLCSPAQNVQHVLDANRNASIIDWEITTSAGTVVESPDKFSLDGSINLKLDAASGPFTSGQINGSLLFTVPTLLQGEIPNPLPFLPPLATFDITNLQTSINSAPFAINPATGDFIAVVTLLTTAGVADVGGLFGSGTENIFGILSLPTAVPGRVTQNGGNVELFLDLDVFVSQDLGGVLVTIDLDGPIVASAASANADPFLLTVPQPLIVGGLATFSATRAQPGGATFLAASLSGLGSTSVPQLGLTLNLANPVQVGNVVTASGAGNASWSAVIPALLAGRSVWFQALQSGRTTQVAGSFAF